MYRYICACFQLTLSAILDHKTSPSPPAAAAAQNISSEIEGLTLAAPPSAEEEGGEDSERSDVPASGAVEWVF